MRAPPHRLGIPAHEVRCSVQPCGVAFEMPPHLPSGDAFVFPGPVAERRYRRMRARPHRLGIPAHEVRRSVQPCGVAFEMPPHLPSGDVFVFPGPVAEPQRRRMRAMVVCNRFDHGIGFSGCPSDLPWGIPALPLSGAAPFAQSVICEPFSGRTNRRCLPPDSSKPALRRSRPLSIDPSYPRSCIRICAITTLPAQSKSFAPSQIRPTRPVRRFASRRAATPRGHAGGRATIFPPRLLRSMATRRSRCLRQIFALWTISLGSRVRLGFGPPVVGYAAILYPTQDGDPMLTPLFRPWNSLVGVGTRSGLRSRDHSTWSNASRTLMACMGARPHTPGLQMHGCPRLTGTRRRRPIAGRGFWQLLLIARGRTVDEVPNIGNSYPGPGMGQTHDERRGEGDKKNVDRTVALACRTVRWRNGNWDPIAVLSRDIPKAIADLARQHRMVASAGAFPPRDGVVSRRGGSRRNPRDPGGGARVKSTRRASARALGGSGISAADHDAPPGNLSPCRYRDRRGLARFTEHEQRRRRRFSGRLDERRDGYG